MFKLRTFQDNDLQLLDKWLHQRYIEKWFDVPGVCTLDDWLYEAKNRHSEFKWITYFIALLEDFPVGFCLYYKCKDAKEDWYGDVSLEGTYSIDYLIGEEICLGKGIGKRMIAQLAEMIFTHENAKKIIVQPDKDNAASCNVLLANGFTFDRTTNIYEITKEDFQKRTVTHGI